MCICWNHAQTCPFKVKIPYCAWARFYGKCYAWITSQGRRKVQKSRGGGETLDPFLRSFCIYFCQNIGGHTELESFFFKWKMGIGTNFESDCEILPIYHKIISFRAKCPFAVHLTLQISIRWLSVISSVIPLALKGILPIHIIPIGKIL